MIKSLDLDDNIEMKGFQKKSIFRYKKSEAFMAWTSRWEGYGLVLVEANSLGVPVVKQPHSGSGRGSGEKMQKNYVRMMRNFLKRYRCF